MLIESGLNRKFCAMFSTLVVVCCRCCYSCYHHLFSACPFCLRAQRFYSHLDKDHVQLSLTMRINCKMFYNCIKCAHLPAFPLTWQTAAGRANHKCSSQNIQQICQRFSQFHVFMLHFICSIHPIGIRVHTKGRYFIEWTILLATFTWFHSIAIAIQLWLFLFIRSFAMPFISYHLVLNAFHMIYYYFRYDKLTFKSHFIGFTLSFRDPINNLTVWRIQSAQLFDEKSISFKCPSIS